MSKSEAPQANKWRVIYVASPEANDLYKEVNKDLLKIGSASLDENPSDDKESLNLKMKEAARKRISEWSGTGGANINLLNVFLAKTSDSEEVTDKEIHKYLERLGYKKIKLEQRQALRGAEEWFRISPDAANQAIINYLDKNRRNLSPESRPNSELLTFRKEQNQAIKKTSKLYNKALTGNSDKNYQMLWNAKPRFGKTATAYGFIKENKIRSVLILTHRPQVNKNWAEDIKKVFGPEDMQYGAKQSVENEKVLSWSDINHNQPFVFFLSLQDARGNERGTNDEDESIFKRSNKEILAKAYDLVIVDEAHEGNETDKAIQVHEEIKRKFTLKLTGTPFRMLSKNTEQFDAESMFTWDYVDEQKAKEEWYITNPGEENPYANLPALSISTINISQTEEDVAKYGESEDDGATDFRKFFELEDGNESNFTEKARGEVLELLSNISPSDKLNHAIDNAEMSSNSDVVYMPYGSSMQKHNKHTMWILPSVGVCSALERLLKDHPVFMHYNIFNVAGNAWEKSGKTKYDTPLDWVLEEGHTQKPYLESVKPSIILTVSRLTVGVTLPALSAVLWLSNVKSPELYIQASFRAQSPCDEHMLDENGNLIPKYQARVYDFAPDRALTLMAEASGIKKKAGVETDSERRQALSEFMNYCPVMAYRGNTLQQYDVNKMMITLKSIYSKEVVESGFKSHRLYSQKLLNMTAEDLNSFKVLRGLAGGSAGKDSNKLEINDQGFAHKQFDQLTEALPKAKQKPVLDAEQLAMQAEIRARREQARDAAAILDAISIRIPLMILGSETYINPVELSQNGSSIELQIRNFVDEMDDESWDEFMGKITKDIFKENLQWFDQDILHGAIIEWLNRIDEVSL